MSGGVLALVGPIWANSPALRLVEDGPVDG
jgi:hypothetical protein